MPPVIVACKCTDQHQTPVLVLRWMCSCGLVASNSKIRRDPTTFHPGAAYTYLSLPRSFVCSSPAFNAALSEHCCPVPLDLLRPTHKIDPLLMWLWLGVLGAGRSTLAPCNDYPSGQCDGITPQPEPTIAAGKLLKADNVCSKH